MFEIEEMNKRYLNQVTRKFAPKADIRPKSQADWKLKISRFVMVTLLRNKHFDRMIQVMGDTIWVPDDFFVDRDPWHALSTIAHETVHIVDFKRFKGFFGTLYLLPQLLGVVALVLAIFHSPWWLFGLAFFAPVPLAWARVWFEYRAYSIDIIFANLVFDQNKEVHLNYHKNKFADLMTTSVYYWAWLSRPHLVKMFEKRIREYSVYADDCSWNSEEVYKLTIDFVLLEKMNRNRWHLTT